MRLGASYGFGWTRVWFGNYGTFDFERHTVALSAEYRATERITLAASAGAVLGGGIGGITDAGLARRWRVEPGWALGAGASWRLLDGEGSRPFLLATFSFGVSSARTSLLGDDGQPAGNAPSMLSADFRGGLLLGKSIAGVLSPYLLARLFGGPVLWRAENVDRFGTDIFHYQIGLGAVLSLGRRVDLGFEFVALGERSLSGSVAIAL